MARNTLQTKKSPDGQNVLLSFFFIRWASSKFSWQFSHKTAAFYTEQCTSHCFFTTLKSSNQSLKNYMASFVTPFSSIVYMCTNRLAAMLLLFKIGDYIQKYSWAHEDRKSLSSIVYMVFEWSLVNDSSAKYCSHLLRQPMKIDLLPCGRWQLSAQACTCC